MSFTSRIKDELAKKNNKTKVENIAELSSIIKNTGNIDDTIKINFDNINLAKKVYDLIMTMYNVSCNITVRRNFNFNKNYLFMLEVNDKITEIKNELEFDKPLPPDYLVGDFELKKTYLRGCFISCGSVNDPKTSRYHLELSFKNLEYAEYIMNLINEFNLDSKIITRDKGYTIYIKQAELICDFLRLIEAYDAVMYFENIRIYREQKNTVNRLNNCEQANVEKTLNAAVKQKNNIEFLIHNDLFDILDAKTKTIAEYRLKYSEVSLVELADIINAETNMKITKSGINHKFRKINTIVSNMENN